MRYSVRHASQLSYARPVVAAQYNLRLAPVPWPGQKVGPHSLQFDPQPAAVESTRGPYHVETTRVRFAQPLRQLEVISRFEVTVERASLQGAEGPSIDRLRALALAERDISPLAPAPYLFASRIAEASERIGAWGAPLLASDTAIVPAASALMHAIREQFAYEPGATDSRTPPEEAFERREGVCQDFAHVMIVALRQQGIPAAYASGYLRTFPPPGKPKLIGADAMHAWANVWCGPELGWVGFDPTNDCLVQDDHVQVAMGRDYADVAPIDGTFIGSAPQTMKVAVDIEEMAEA